MKCIYDQRLHQSTMTGPLTSNTACLGNICGKKTDSVVIHDKLNAKLYTDQVRIGQNGFRLIFT